MRIGIVSNIDNGRGLQRDYEMLKSLCEEAGHEVVGLHFKKSRLQHPFDLLICLEVPGRKFHYAAPVKWFVPNLEWLEVDEDLSCFDVVIAKTRLAEEVLSKRHDNVVYTGWSTRDMNDPDVKPIPRKAVHIWGYANLKGGDAVCSAFRDHGATEFADLTIIHRHENPPPGPWRTVKSPDDKKLRRLLNEASIIIQPSRMEGWGCGLREALSTGGLLITTDGAPMNELRSAAYCVEAERDPVDRRSSPVWNPKPESIAAAVKELASLDPKAIYTNTIRQDARDFFLDEALAFREMLFGLLERVGSGPPILSFCIPHAPGREKITALTIAAIAKSDVDPKDIEVVVAVDGGDSTPLMSALTDTYDVAVKVVESPRPRGADKAHRNHARNMAWRNAEGRLCFIMDCDFLVERDTARHIIEAEERLRVETGKPVVLSPCMGEIKPGGGLGEVYAGYLSRYEESDEVTTEGMPALPEGMPIVPKKLLTALGGFDEDFGEWGADKEEFTARLRQLGREELISIHLLTSTLILHQPHPTDPEKGTPDCSRRQAEQRRRERAMKEGASWWRVQRQRVKDMLGEIMSDGRSDLLSSAAVHPTLEELARQAVRKGTAKRGMIGCCGEYARQVCDHIERELGIEAKVLNGEEDPESLRALAVADGNMSDVEKYGYALRKNGGMAMLVWTRHNGRGHPAPLAYQRYMPGLSLNGYRTLPDGKVVSMMTGRLVRVVPR